MTKTLDCYGPIDGKGKHDFRLDPERVPEELQKAVALAILNSVRRKFGQRPLRNFMNASKSASWNDTMNMAIPAIGEVFRWIEEYEAFNPPEPNTKPEGWRGRSTDGGFI